MEIILHTITILNIHMEKESTLVWITHVNLMLALIATYKFGSHYTENRGGTATHLQFLHHFIIIVSVYCILFIIFIIFINITKKLATTC